MAALGVAVVGVASCQIADPKPKNAQTPRPTQRDLSQSGADPRLENPRPAPQPAPQPAVRTADVTAAREQALLIVETLVKSSDAQQRANAVELAGAAPKRLHSVIQAGLLDPNPGVRSVALVVVGRNRMQEFREIIRPLARDQNGMVKAGAIFALHAFGDAPDQTPLAALLLTDDSPWVNRQAAFVIGEIGNPSALPLLQSASSQRVSQVPPAQQRIFQVQLTEAMVKVGSQEQRAALVAALYPSQSDDIEVAMLAVQAIGETGDKAAVAQLIGLLGHQDRQGNPYPAELRVAVAGSLGRLGMDTGMPIATEMAMSKDDAIRAQAAHALGHIGAGTGKGQAAISALAPMLDDESELVRLASAGAVLRCTK
jgi:HEAT repeat protein